MNDRKNEEMAGSVSEPGAPEVKPAKSLWPRPYENVRVEPSLESTQVEDASVTVSNAAAPAGDFEKARAESLEERAEPRFDPVGRDEPELLSEPAPSLAPEVEGFVPETEAERTVEKILEEHEADGEEGQTVEDVLEENETAADTPSEDRLERVEPSVLADSDRENPDISVEPLRAREDERAGAVLGAAERQTPPLAGSGESRGGQFIAMAAGIIVALALGAAALVYGASALGFSFGGGNDSIAENNPPPAVPTPVVNVSEDELKAAQQKIDELQARLDQLESEKAEAAKTADASKAAETAPAEQNASAEPAQPPAPAPRPETAAAPAPTPAPEAQPASPAPSSPATPAASANQTAPESPARSEPTPPQQSARVELGAPPRPLAPPPSYNTQPSYEQQRPAASPEMPVLQNWAVRDVYNGIAVVQSGRGAPMEVEPGDELPGGNRVLAIRRLGGAWAVITERGIIAAR